MSALGDRIRMLRKEKQLSQPEFAKKIGISNGHISFLETGKQEANDRMIRIICQEFNVSETWLRDGSGPMFASKSVNILESLTQRFQLDALDQRMLMEYMSLSHEQRGVFKHFIKKVLESEELGEDVQEEEAAVYTFRRTIPILGRVAGGRPILALEDGQETVQTDANCDAALVLCGDSMEPDYPDGCILLVKRQPELHHGDLGIVLLLKGADIAEATFKKVLFDDGHITLRALNPVYQDTVIRSIDVLFFGRVVGSLVI